MLFNLFGKKESAGSGSLFTDKVFAGANAKLNAMLQLAIEKPDTIFIAWFADTAKKCREFFQQHGINESRVKEAKFIHGSDVMQHTPVFTEHHPLAEKEEGLVKSWDKKPFLVFSSLDEALFKHFGSDKVIPMMKMLGMKEDEAIEHSMVTKSIVNAQHKIASKVIVEQSAGSQEEWLEKNLQ